MGEELVKVADAPNEPEAAVICGYLESVGIEATYDGRDAAVEAFGGLAGQTEFGPQEILVRAEDAERARAALAARDTA